jgi:hypothetical protein
MDTTNDKTLGQRIGKVSKACKVTNAKGDAVTINVIIDFSTSTDSDIRAWLASDRIIAGQRPWRALSKQEIEELDSQTFNANSIGTKVKSRSEQLNDLMTVFVNAGVDATQALALANAALDNPSSLTITQ